MGPIDRAEESIFVSTFSMKLQKKVNSNLGHNLHSVLNDPRSVSDIHAKVTLNGNKFVERHQDFEVIMNKSYPSDLDQRRNNNAVLSYILNISFASEYYDDLVRYRSNGPKQGNLQKFNRNSCEVSPDKGNAFVNTLVKGVPELYFKSPFDMRNPQLFLSVINDNGNETLSIIRDSLTATLNLYLDSVELRLWGHICHRFTHFYGALNQLMLLHKRICRLVSEVTSKRLAVKHIYKKAVKKNLIALQLNRRLFRLQKLHKLLVGALKARDAAKYSCKVLSQKDCLLVLPLVTKLRKFFQSYIKSLFCVESFSKKLYNTHLAALNMLSQRFEHSYISMPGKVSDLVDLKKETLTNLINTLVSSGLITKAFLQYRKRLSYEVDNVFETSILMYFTSSQSIEENDIEKGNKKIGNGAKYLVTQLAFTQFLSFLKIVIEHLSGLIARARVGHLFLADYIDTIDQTVPCEVNSKDGESLDSMDTNMVCLSVETLSFVCERAQECIHNILQMRKYQHYNIPLNDMKDLWDLSIAFVRFCETEGGKRNFIIRTTLLEHAQASFEGVHDRHITHLINILNTEKWKEYKISTDLKITLSDMFSDSAAERGNARNISKLIEEDSIMPGKDYYIVTSMEVLIQFVKKYLFFARVFPDLAKNIRDAILALFQTFNQRCRQLVLAGGAFASGTVKSISVKHLALVSQCLGLAISILPHIRICLEKYIPPTQGMVFENMDKLVHMLHEHRNSVIDKSVAIIVERIEIAFKSLVESTNIALRGNAVSKYMMGIVSDLTTMHKVLSEILSLLKVIEIFDRILGKLINDYIV